MKTVFSLPGTAFLLFFFAQSLISAATFRVDVRDTPSFFPAVSRINVNDTINWVWVGFNSHSSTHRPPSGPRLWDSGLHGNGFQFSRQFTSAGSFPYFCSNFQHPNQTGTVVVAAANVAPTVAITFPSNGMVFAAPANINILADASDADNNLMQVEFFRNSISLGVDTSGPSPYRGADANVPAGSYTYRATATDDGGLQASHQVSVSVVTPVPVQLSAPQKTSADEFAFRYASNAGLRYLVEKSKDLALWEPVSTNTATGASSMYEDKQAGTAQSFYRVARLPNP